MDPLPSSSYPLLSLSCSSLGPTDSPHHFLLFLPKGWESCSLYPNPGSECSLVLLWSLSFPKARDIISVSRTCICSTPFYSRPRLLSSETYLLSIFPMQSSWLLTGITKFSCGFEERGLKEVGTGRCKLGTPSNKSLKSGVTGKAKDFITILYFVLSFHGWQSHRFLSPPQITPPPPTPVFLYRCISKLTKIYGMTIVNNHFRRISVERTSN